MLIIFILFSFWGKGIVIARFSGFAEPLTPCHLALFGAMFKGFIPKPPFRCVNLAIYPLSDETSRNLT
jgi:hypothetical protein